jgi:rod shape-determining protein MreD
MIRYLLWALTLFLVFIIQGSISFFDIRPNLTVVLACYAGIRQREIKGMLFGSVIGIIEDSLSGAFLGPNLLSKGIIGFLSSFMSNKFFIWTPLLGIISIFVLTMIDGVIVFVSRGLFATMPATIGNAAFVIIIQSLLNAPLGIFLKPKKEQ